MQSTIDVAMLSPEETAGRLGCSRRTVYRLIAAGELEAVRVGGMLRVDPRDLERFLARHSSFARSGAAA